jgi:hypothetical protein
MHLAHRVQVRAPALSRIFAALFLSGTLSASALAQAPPCNTAPQFCHTEYGPPQYNPPDYNPLVDTRCGGVLQQSFDYQRGGQGPPPAPAPAPGLISPATPWYHYGFPVSTYRWGWFGAEHYYPTVWWAHGYYGDCCRYGYRCGY